VSRFDALQDVKPAHQRFTDDRAQVSELAKRAQEETGETVEIVFVDQGYTGENAADAAEEHGIKLEVVKLTTAERGFGLLLRRWVVERSFGWM
jgi:transposase